MLHETAPSIETCYLRIRKYGSTFYIGIAMVILPYFGPMGKVKFQFSLSVSTPFDFYQHPMGNMLKANDIRKKSRKACNTGVIHILLLLPVEEQYLNTRNTNKHENLHVYIFFPGMCTV